MAETERTLHDELVDAAQDAIYGADDPARAVVAALLPVFRAKLLSDEAVDAGCVAAVDDDVAIWHSAMKKAFSAALDHVCGPEGGESRG
jgi:hypothetical protein